MTETTNWKDWRIFFGTSMLLLAIVSLISDILIFNINQLQIVIDVIEGKAKPLSVFYWGLFSFGGANPLLWLIIITAFWLVRPAKNINANRIADLLFRIATFLAIISFVLQIYSVFDSKYYHQSSADFDGHRYNVGIISYKHDMYVVCKCDSLGIFCDCWAVGYVMNEDDPEKPNKPKYPVLKRDPKTQGIYIEDDNQIIPINRYESYLK